MARRLSPLPGRVAPTRVGVEAAVAALHDVRGAPPRQDAQLQREGLKGRVCRGTGYSGRGAGLQGTVQGCRRTGRRGRASPQGYTWGPGCRGAGAAAARGAGQASGGGQSGVVDPTARSPAPALLRRTAGALKCGAAAAAWRQGGTPQGRRGARPARPRTRPAGRRCALPAAVERQQKGEACKHIYVMPARHQRNGNAKRRPQGGIAARAHL